MGPKRNSLAPKQRRTKEKSEMWTERDIMDPRAPVYKTQIIVRAAERILQKERISIW